jgi:hypothetical protein
MVKTKTPNKEKNQNTPFKFLELQLKLEDIEKRWKEAKESYDKNTSAKDVDEVLKLTVEKITILTEMSYYTYEA